MCAFSVMLCSVESLIHLYGLWNMHRDTSERIFRICRPHVRKPTLFFFVQFLHGRDALKIDECQKIISRCSVWSWSLLKQLIHLFFSAFRILSLLRSHTIVRYDLTLLLISITLTNGRTFTSWYNSCFDAPWFRWYIFTHVWWGIRKIHSNSIWKSLLTALIAPLSVLSDYQILFE